MTVGLGDAGEILDPQARAEYKERLESLREELEEARRFNDPGRVGRLEGEIEFLNRELSAAFGIGGRAKKAADSTERIRKAVSGRVRGALLRIQQEHPQLGAHLSRAIRTGTFCSYAPEKTVDWSL